MNFTEAFKPSTETPVENDVDEAMETLKVNCSQAIKTLRKNGTVITRVFENAAQRGTKSDIAIWHGNQQGRTSKNTKTYYNEFIDHLSEWRAYPKRSESLICSMNHTTSEPAYIYYIMPFDDISIGLCHNNDIWFSFPTVEAAWKIPDMSKFGQFFGFFMNACHTDAPEDNWQAMKPAIQSATKFLQGLSLSEVEARLSETTHTSDAAADSVLTCKQKFNGDLMSYFSWLLNPTANEFTVVTPDTMNTSVRKECWLSGKCVIISGTFFQDHLKDELLEA